MIEYKVSIDECGTKRWYLNDKLHRECGPAIEFTNGNKYWYINGNKHRLDGPAIEAWGCKYWYIKGVRYYKQEFKDILKTNLAKGVVNKNIKYTLIEV
jgi:hypothetical protein